VRSGPRLRRALLLVSSIPALHCQRQEPPGAQSSAPVKAASLGVSSASAQPANHVELGTQNDNLPFSPTGAKLASIAWRTWVYTDTGAKRTRFGYLRAGAVVNRREPPVINSGCAGGWYRINPRGFVCVGKGATLTLGDPVVQIASVRAVRGQSLPYLYALADDDNPPFLYFRLPNKAEIKHIEGDMAFDRAAAFRVRQRSQGLLPLLGEPGPPPEFLHVGKVLVKPYGTAERLHYSTHSGRAAPDSGFAIARTFSWDERLYGLTSEHDVVALDRTRLVRPSEFRGVELAAGEGLPVAFVENAPVPRYELDATSGQLRGSGSFTRRQGIKLTGKRHPNGGSWEARDASWVAPAGLRILMPRESFPSFATGDRKWIDISINRQSLVAYTGQIPVYATLVSTGRGGLGDPEKVDATVRGTFMIYQKDVSSTMDGSEDRSDGYALQDVPFVQYFHKGFALHGTYWHDEFGKLRSHGCVNLSPIDAAWLFEWTDPAVPSDWHGVINKERGTVVHIHP
jgi:hypothetical protein